MFEGGVRILGVYYLKERVETWMQFRGNGERKRAGNESVNYSRWKFLKLVKVHRGPLNFKQF